MFAFWPLHSCLGPYQQGNSGIGQIDQQVSHFFNHKLSTLHTLADTREWHVLLAAKSIQQRLSTATPTTNEDIEGRVCATEFSYWRWRGFLCRYELYKPVSNKKESSSSKFGMLLIHGFGATGRQWKNTTEAIYSNLHSLSSERLEVLAPDMIGYGYSEKPQITFTSFCGKLLSSTKNAGMGL